jgi:hypothetical protein
MRLSRARARESPWVWMFYFLGLGVPLNVGLFLGVGYVLGLPFRALFVPFLLFFPPQALVGPFIYRINRRYRGQPGRYAVRMGMVMVVLTLAAGAAALHIGMQLHLWPRISWPGVVFAEAFGASVVYFTARRYLLHRLTAELSRGASPAGRPPTGVSRWS